MRYLVAGFVFVAAAASADAGKAKWYNEGFMENAGPEHPTRAAAAAGLRRDDGKEQDRWFRCSAVRQAQFKSAEVFVERGEDANHCQQDSDCAVGNLGGMCSVAAHKVQIFGYALFQKSSEYKYLAEAWKADRCMGPMGLCLPVNVAQCQKNDKGEGVCVGKTGRTHTEPSVLFAGK